jgi:hypothetical protein
MVSLCIDNYWRYHFCIGFFVDLFTGKTIKQHDKAVSMIILWIILGAICGSLSLLFRMVGKDYGNFLTGLLSWVLFACVIALVTRRNRNLFQFIGGTAFAGTMIMVWGMLPLEVIVFIPRGEAISKTIEFAYLSRAVAGALSGIGLYYLWRQSEKVRPISAPADRGSAAR